MHLQRLLQPTALLTSYNCWSKARLHHRSCDHVFARRAALLSGICLAAMALVGADVALAQEGPLIYVPNLNGNNVTVIDTSTNTVLPVTIPVGSVALAAAVRGDQSLVYVSNGGDNTVSVIDTPTNTVIATIPVGILPTLIALSPDNRRAYVANQGSNDVTVIDTVTNTVVATIPVGTQATGVAVTPDGTSVYATNTASSTVSVIDTATNTVGATISVGTAPQGVTVTPDGTRVYVTNGISNDVTVIATATNTVVATIPAGVNPAVVTITPDGTRAYVANQGSDNVTVIDTATNTVVTTIPVGTQATGVVINRDGTFAYVTNTASNTVSASELDRSTGGFLTGIDALVSDNARLGLLGGYSYSSFDVDDRFSSGRANSVHLGAYGGLQRNKLGLRGGAAYSWHFIDTSRTAAFGNFSETLDADYHAGTAQVFGEAGYRIDTNRAAFEPFANLAYVNFRTNGFNETGGVAALSHSSDNTDQTFTTLGVRVSMPLSFGDSEAKLSGMIGWRHAFNDVTPESGFAFAGGAPFLISGIPIAEDALALETGIDIKLDEKFSLGIGYSGQIGNDTQDHSANARLTISF